MKPLKLGLINYMVSVFDPAGERDLVFIPVGINYDRVLEDRSLIRKLDPDASQYNRQFIFTTLLKWLAHNLILIFRQRWYRFGYACVNFGTPISMRSYVSRHKIDFPTLEPNARFEAIERLGDELLVAIAATVPVLPVSLVATVFVRYPDQPMSELEIKTKVQGLIDELETRKAYIHVPRGNRDYALSVGLRMLVLRHFVVESDGLYRVCVDEQKMLCYYANAIEHFFDRQIHLKTRMS